MDLYSVQFRTKDNELYEMDPILANSFEEARIKLLLRPWSYNCTVDAKIISEIPLSEKEFKRIQNKLKKSLDKN